MLQSAATAKLMKMFEKIIRTESSMSFPMSFPEGVNAKKNFGVLKNGSRKLKGMVWYGLWGKRCWVGTLLDFT